MKTKTLISFLLALLPLIGVAQRISDAEALSIASAVLDKPVTKAVPSKPLRAPSVNGGAEIAQPFFDIYTGDDGRGFVIVSTDRRAPQVIGYGDGKCDANNLPPQLAAILARQDSVLRADSSLPDHPSWLQRAPRLAEAAEAGKLLKTANWGQGYPYNLMTPEIDGEHCPTGCVATAMAIVMKFHNWPEKGRGQHTYNWNGQDLSFDYTNTTFDWSSMPDEYSDGNFTDEQALEVSKLMRAAGNAVDMEYGNVESGAYFSTISYTMYKNFKYEIPFGRLKIDNFYNPLGISYSDIEWINMIEEEIDNDRVMIYSGNNGFVGHAFVIDGYDSYDKLHINWGWNGTLNGYFSLGEMLYGNNPDLISMLLPDKEATECEFCSLLYN